MIDKEEKRKKILNELREHLDAIALRHSRISQLIDHLKELDKD